MPSLKLPRPAPQLLEQMVKELCGDTRFQVFIDQLRGMREAAIQDLCNDEVAGNAAKTAVAIGEVRTYSAMLGLVDAYIGNISIIDA